MVLLASCLSESGNGRLGDWCRGGASITDGSKSSKIRPLRFGDRTVESGTLRVRRAAEVDDSGPWSRLGRTNARGGDVGRLSEKASGGGHDVKGGARSTPPRPCSSYESTPNTPCAGGSVDGTSEGRGGGGGGGRLPKNRKRLVG
jgi:hypothetical protein